MSVDINDANVWQVSESIVRKRGSMQRGPNLSADRRYGVVIILKPNTLLMTQSFLITSLAEYIEWISGYEFNILDLQVMLIRRTDRFATNLMTFSSVEYIIRCQYCIHTK